MIIGNNAIAAAVATLMLAGGAGAAQAQSYYGYGELPPPPYAYSGGYGGGYGGGCSQKYFTLLGARAGVTVLGVDLDASAHLGVPVDEACGGQAPAFQPRPYAPPPPAPMAYGYQGCQTCQGYSEPAYAPPPPPPPMNYGYAQPCGCAMPQRW